MDSVSILDSKTGVVTRRLPCPCEDVRSVAFSPDGRYLAAAGRGGIVRIWEASTWKHARDIRADRRRIRAVAFSPDGAQLATAGDGRSIRIWNVATGAEQLMLTLAPRQDPRVGLHRQRPSGQRWQRQLGPPMGLDHRHLRSADGRPHRFRGCTGVRPCRQTTHFGELRHNGQAVGFARLRDQDETVRRQETTEAR